MSVIREWKESMGEISGFGGGYEAVCRAMVLTGIQWIDEHPDLECEFGELRNVFGVCTEENDNAKALTNAMMDAPVYHKGVKIQEHARDDATGAMHHAAINHVMAYKRLGWDEYVRQLETRGKDDEPEQECSPDAQPNPAGEPQADPS